MARMPAMRPAISRRKSREGSVICTVQTIRGVESPMSIVRVNVTGLSMTVLSEYSVLDTESLSGVTVNEPVIFTSGPNPSRKRFRESIDMFRPVVSLASVPTVTEQG